MWTTLYTLYKERFSHNFSVSRKWTTQNNKLLCYITCAAHHQSVSEMLYPNFRGKKQKLFCFKSIAVYDFV